MTAMSAAMAGAVMLSAATLIAAIESFFILVVPFLLKFLPFKRAGPYAGWRA